MARSKVQKIEPGLFILAQPFMHDAYFNRSVIYLCETGQGGSIGFVVNRPMKVKIHELVDDFPPFEGDMYFGGPVGNDTLHFLHTMGDLIEGSNEVSEGIFWGGDFEKVKFLISSNLLQPHNIHFIVGYSGWTSGQLEAEMHRGSWIQVGARQEHIFEKDPYRLWQTLMEEKGENYSIISQMPDSAVLN